MSLPVTTDALRARVEEFGPVAFVVTVGSSGPHVVSVETRWDGDALVAAVGRTTLANVAADGRVTVLWPPLQPGGAYALVVDAEASADTAAGELRAAPTSAVLHRVAGVGDDAGPGCLPVDS